MVQRLLLVILFAFWVMMNALLVEKEFASGGESGHPIPPEVVWEKILTSPDNSSLIIHQNGERIGYCRLSANQTENLESRRRQRNQFDPEGMIRQLSSYTLDLDGSVLLPGKTNRFQFNMNLEVTTNQLWKAVQVRLSQRPKAWTFQAVEQEKVVVLGIMDGNYAVEETLTFEDLANPEKLLTRYQAGWVLGVAGTMLGRKDFSSLSGLNPRLEWRAFHDRLRIGTATARVFRISSQFMNRYDVSLYVSRVGEIVKIELPNGITIFNDEFSF